MERLVYPEEEYQAVAAAVERLWKRRLPDREARLLFALAYAGPGEGAIVEIGSFVGRSTIFLARGSLAAGRERVVAIDPHTVQIPPDPQFPNEKGTEGVFRRNLEKMGVAHHVEVHVKLSQEVAREWKGPVRLLWIDGDHTYPSVRLDFDLWNPFLVPGGVIVFHDVLRPFDGPLPVFLESVLLSDDFSSVQIVGSIAMACKSPVIDAAERKAKATLARCMRRLLPYLSPSGKLSPLRKVIYKFWRAQIPH